MHENKIFRKFLNLQYLFAAGTSRIHQQTPKQPLSAVLMAGDYNANSRKTFELTIVDCTGECSGYS